MANLLGKLCIILISVQFVVTLKITYLNNGPAFPANVKIYEGENVFVHMPKQLDIKHCGVKPPLKEFQDLIPGDSDNSNRFQYWGRGLQYFDCGIQIMNASTGDSGSWILKAYAGINNETTQAHFSVDVLRSSLFKLQAEEEISGSSYYSWNDCSKESELKCMYCEIKSPTNYSYPWNDTCTFEINDVRKENSGAWTIRIGVEGLTETYLYKKDLTVISEQVQCQWKYRNYDTDGAISILCYLENYDPIYFPTFCYFVRPGDQVTFNLIEGLSTGLYSYYGEGIKNYECGITIERPAEIDYGNWQVVFGNASAQKIYAARIFLPRNTSRNVKSQVNHQIDVLLGKSTVISCTSDFSLLNCMFLSPNNTVFHGKTQYFGFGKCIISIPNVTPSDAGTWTCHLYGTNHIDSSTELITVNIQGSALIAKSKKLEVFSGEEVNILCTALSELSDNNYTSRISNLQYCKFTRPDGSSFYVDNFTSLLNGQYLYYGQGLHSGDCGIKINVTGPQDNGKWTCSGKLNGNEFEHKDFVQVQVKNSRVVFPSNLTTSIGQDVSIYMMDQSLNLVSCMLMLPNGYVSEIAISEEVQLIENYGMTLGQKLCGAKIFGKVFSNLTYGYEPWKLLGKDSSGRVINGTVWINVSGEEIVKHEIISRTITTEIGSNLTFSCGEISSGIYCVIIPPEDNSDQHIPGDCVKIVQAVSFKHIGTWKCLLGTSLASLELEEVIVVRTKNTEILAGWSKSNKTRDSYDIFCNVEHSLNFCRFLDPDGNGIKISDGLAKEHYSYGGSGIDKGECVITIQTPQKTDFGLWRCFVGYERNGTREMQAGFINFSKNEKNVITNDISNIKELIVVVGAAATISCKFPRTLSYCWFKHPNGTYIVSQTGKSNLLIGKCEITIAIIKNSDGGRWLCHLSPVNSSGEEITQSITVQVTESSLHAGTSMISAYSGSEVSLMCYAIPKWSALEYCRFVRPDGKGFNIDETMSTLKNKYQYFGKGLTKGECGLKILNVKNEDFGLWKCAAYLKKHAKEDFDLINVTNSGTDVNLILLISLISCGSIVGLIVGIYFYKKKFGPPLSQIT